MKKMILSLLAIAAMTSCTTTSEDEIDPNAPVEINFNAGINIVSRAINQDETTGALKSALTGIQILRGQDGDAPEFENIENVTATADMQINGKFDNISTNQYFNAGHETANFIAYYPVANTYAKGLVSYVIDGTQDIIVSEAVNKAFSTTDNAASFQFSHKLARVKLVLHAENAAAISSFGSLTGATITVSKALDLTINANGTTSLAANTADAKKGTLDFGSATLVAETDVDATNEFMILPSENITNINMTFDKKAATDYTISNLSLEVGKITTITVTIKATGVDFTSSIDKWADGGIAGTGTVQ